MKLSDEQYTPKSLFDQLGLTFDLDVAAPINSKSHVPALRKYTQLDDGLIQPWEGRVWMNPPFSKVTPWVDKFIEHGNGIALLVVSRSYWFAKLWEVADGIVSTESNLKFDRPDGTKNSISFQTFLFALGEENAKALDGTGKRVR
jgi:hypothetical protein